MIDDTIRNATETAKLSGRSADNDAAAKARHPHAGAQYCILPRKGIGYAVEITIPDMNATMVTGFSTMQQASAWVAGHKHRVASGLPSLRWRRPSSAAKG